VLGELAHELAVVDRRDLDRNILAERHLLRLEQHRHEHRGRQREHDCTDEAPPCTTTQFIELRSNRVGHETACEREKGTGGLEEA
jgi:hypothetical protein